MKNSMLPTFSNNNTSGAELQFEMNYLVLSTQETLYNLPFVPF